MRRLVRHVLQLLALSTTTQGVKCLELSGQKLTNVTATSNSFAFYSDNTLITTVSASALSQETSILLQNNSLTSIPATFFQAANNVTSINISSNPLTTLEAQSFVNLPYLQSISCTNTNVTALVNGLVKDCPKLTTISFKYGSIEKIESQALVNLPALNSLDLSYNQLETVPSALFTVASSWKALEFSHNNIMEVPAGIRSAVAEGYISLDYNALVELQDGAFAGASEIHELRLASNAIFTVNSKVFSGMSALRKLNLSDNVISVIDEDAFAGVDGLEELRLDTNNLHRLTLSSVPTNLELLELQGNLMDLMPDFPDDFQASCLVYLNMSRNFLWSISTNDALTPYTGLEALDFSNNRIVNFSGSVFDPIMSTIKYMNFDSNLITSIPSTNFISLVTKLLTNITLVNNPGIGWSSDVDMRNDCPNGSVFEEASLSSSGSADDVLYGCIQCVAGTFHDNSTGTCVACSKVSSRAYSEEDGATVCLYCPYSSDLAADRTLCDDFECNILCWLTLSMGIAIPGVIFSSKFLLYLIMKSSKRTRKMDIKEQEAMNDWRMGLMMHQLAEPMSPSDSLLDDDIDDVASDKGEMPVRIYDLPEETKDLVLSTLRDYFQIRKEKAWRALPPDEQEATREWNDVEWETFHMHRILSRSYHGEVFLGDYCGTQVVVKRMMTLRFEVKELAETIKDVELVMSLHHPSIVMCLGTMWSDPEHLCVISEYVKGGDLTAVLEVDGLDRPNNARMSASSAQILSPPRNESRSDVSDPTSSQTAYGMSKTSLIMRFQMALDICKALVYMHNKGVSHSDLRSRNVMVTDMFRCKIADARHHSRDNTHHATHVLLVENPAEQNSDSEEEGANLEGVRFLQPDQQETGPTIPLVAPEVLHHNSRHLHADIYSVGILLLELWFHTYISFQNDRPNDEFGARNRTKKLRLTIDGDETESCTTGKEDAALPRTASALQKNKEHNAAMRHFMSKLRMLANVGGTDPEADESSFGTTPTSSAASLTVSLSSSSAIVDKLSGAIEDCLQSDPKRRPTAKKLVELFQFFLDEISAT